MPYRAPAACQPGCPHPRRSCPDHPPARWADGAPGRAMPPGWNTTRRRVLARDGGRCRICGQPATEVHHARPGDESDAALLSLCSPCHLAVTLDQARRARLAASP